MAAEPYWIERTDVELDDAMRVACTAATASKQPVLLTFSAPWCGDCRKVRSLESSPPLREELQRWTKVVVNIGRFDRHEALLDAFEVQSVARWVALKPDCSEPLTRWKRLRSSVFEPASKPDGLRTSADLAAWLVTARTLEP